MTTSIQSSQQKYRHFGFTDDPSLTDALEQLRRLDGERSHAAVLRKIVRNGVAARLAAAANSPRSDSAIRMLAGLGDGSLPPLRTNPAQ